MAATEQTSLLRELQECEERYRNLVEQSSDAIVLIQQGVITFLNRAGVNLFCASDVGEVVGRSILEFHDPVGRERIRKHLAVLVRDRSAAISEEDRIVALDGSIHDVEVSASSYLRQGEVVIQMVFHDRSEHKRMVLSLAESEIRLGLAVDAAGMGSWDIDVRTGKAIWSARALAIMGREPGDQPDCATVKESILPEDLGAFMQALEFARMNRTLFRIEHRIVRHHDRRTLWVSSAGRYLYDDDGQASRFIGIFFDITSLKQSEQQVRHLNASLEEKVARRTAALETANRELDSFSYTVSHDLRAPLRAIAGFARILDDEHKEDWNPESQAYLGRIVGAANRMSQLIDDLLSLSRVSRKEVAHQYLDLAPMAAEIAEELQQSDPQRVAAFRIEEKLGAHGDPALLRVVLQNLMANAWKFTSGQPDTVIDIGRGSPEEPSAFYVRDNGCGFDMEYVGKLFQPFQRLHTMRDYPGTGIGLATVQRIIERHRGNVWAFSGTQSGATFYFSLWTK